MRSLALLCVWMGFSVHAHGQVDQRLAQRHAEINALYEVERYDEVIETIQLQVQHSAHSTWSDSLYQYIYKLGRANWKVKGTEAAVNAAELLYASVAQGDPDPGIHLKALSGLSWLYYDLGDMKACLRVDSMALLVAKANPQLGYNEVAHAYQNIGFDHASMSNHQLALRSYLAAKANYERSEVPPYYDLAECFNGAGVSSWHLGRTRDAERYYREALTDLDRSKNANVPLRKAGILSNMGIMWQDAGDIARCKENYQKAIQLSTIAIDEFTDPSDRERAILSRSKGYVNLATVYFSLGDNDRSQQLLDLAFRDRAGIMEPNDPRLIGVRERMADIAIETGDMERAETYITEFLEVTAIHFGQQSEDHLRAGTKLAEVYASSDRFEEADSLFQRCIVLQRALPQAATDPQFAIALRRRARFQLDRGKVAEAMADLVEARSIVERIHGKDHFKAAMYEVLLAEAALTQGDPATALKWSNAAIDHLQERTVALERSDVPVAFPQPHLLPDAILWNVKAQHALSVASTPDPIWNEQIDLAIKALDRNRAAIDDEGSQLGLVGAQKKLFDLAIDLAYEAYAVNGREADVDRFLDLIEADRSILLKSRLNDFSSLRFAGVPDSVLLREQELIEAMAIDPDEEGAVDRAMDSERSFLSFLHGLNEKYPRYFALRYGTTTIHVADVRKKLLKPGRDLLAYAITDAYMYMLVIRTDTALIVRKTNVGVDETVHALVDAISLRERASYAAAGYRAYDTFFAPVASFLKGEELLIIPDGPLHTVNFEALLTDPSPTELVRNALIQRYAMAYLLSATTAVQFADLVRDRSQGVLALAPGFADSDKQRYVAATTDTGAIDRDYLNYVRQPFAVNTVRSLGRTLNATMLLGGEANESEFRERAARFGVLHLGTHAEMNGTSPMYSRLVLSKLGSATDADSDGYLYAYEIYELDLRAQLAVLTACETGTGRNDRGEGVRSLGYGFAYAGCPSLVMSLWSIDEKVSAEIIERFYMYLAEGMSKHHALRQAKLDHLATAQDELALPYYWAGLVLVGDVEPVDVGDTWIRYAGWGVGAFAVVLILVLLFMRRKGN